MTDILLSLAERLSDLGLAQPFSIGKYRENPALPVQALEELPATPDTALSLTIVNQRDDRDPYNPDVDVRIRFRAAGHDVRTVHGLADRTKTLLHTPEPTADRQWWPGGLAVITCFRIVRGQAIRDSNGRWMRPDTYRLTPHTGSGD